MMTGDGRKSPVHVHVDRETPVHVHLKKKKKGKPGVPTAVEQRLRTKRQSGLTRSTGQRKAIKSSSPPFVPPPGKTSKRPFAWEGPSHRLEVSPPHGGGTLRMEDLSTSEEDEVHGKIRSYEKKIGSLMSEVGSLKTERDMQRARQAVEKKDEQLDASRRILEAQEDELFGYKQELKATVKENEALRHSIEKWKEDADVTRSEVGKLAGERAAVLKKLVEVEMDGKAAGEQVIKLRDTIRKLKEDKRMSAADTTLLTRQREMLLQKLDEFERTNKALRRLLREQQATEEEHDHLRKQQEVLLKRLTQSDTTNERLQVELSERDRQIETLLAQVEADKDQAVAFEELKKTMETTRAHLQNQLRSKEMECGRLSVQIRSLEEQYEQGRIEVEHMQGLIAAHRDKNSREKEALKKAARIQKDRVSERDKDLEVLQEKLAEKDLALSETKRAEASLKEEKSDAEIEIKTLKNRLKEMHELVDTTEKAAQSNSESLTAKLSTRTQEVNTLRLDNEQLQADVAALEERLHEEEQRAANKCTADLNEINQLRTAIKEYEELIGDYKVQIDKYRREAEDSKNRLYEYEAEAQKMHQESALENEKVKIKMQKRLSELEPLADLLKSSDARLQDSQERILAYERRSNEHAKLISELTQKVETQTDQLEHLREKLRMAQDETRSIQAKNEVLERKLADSDQQNRELIGVISKKEESLYQTQQRQEDLRAENIRLNQQLESSVLDTRRQVDSQKEKALVKERAAHARISDLEAQLSRATVSMAELKRSKDETERRYNSKLFDMRDRLEQANSTTRSMQNYVSFLKSSYSNVFDELESPR
ncbi:outer dense fiber protein 2-like isoform X1 [Stylophora pistillata]|uniref:outer dense fiber protein 2-like isoform X1 n=1 Tax=Stylophora pistillata TaxID=50429 RepID=UPI000C048EEB|nr:outer dense fiber protein 2-like isoform X1 [Stylophora pistillata]